MPKSVPWVSPDLTVAADLDAIIETCRVPLDELANSTILLTGGSGFVGSYLVETFAYWNHRFPNQRCRLLLPTRDVAALRARSPRLFGLNPNGWRSWTDVLASPPGGPVSLIIHAASPADPASYSKQPARTIREIIEYTGQVIEFARRTQANRILYISSGAVYGRQPECIPSIEEVYSGGPDPLAAASCYGEAKRVSELLCQLSGIPTVVARLFTFLGPYQDLGASFAVPDFLRMAIREGVIRINSDGRAQRTFCYSSDLTASLIHLAVSGNPGEAYNVGCQTPVLTIRELAELISQSIRGTSVEVLGAPGKGAPSRYLPSVKKLSMLYSPVVGIENALSRVITSLCLRGVVEPGRIVNWDRRIAGPGGV